MQIEADVYSYGGCTSCGSSLWDFLRRNKIKVNHTNVQVPYERRNAIARAKELGVEQVYFPLIFIGGKVVVGFKPDELNNIIKEVKHHE